MSDTIKLSELLSSAAYACEVRHDACRDAGLKHGARICIFQAAALRAIAPALVEVIRNSHNTCSCAFDCPECPHCHLSRAMKEAGVTCD